MKRAICFCLVMLMLIALCACQGISIQIGPKETEAPTATPYIKSSEETYQEAKKLMNACDFEEAKTVFQEIKNYKDSKNLVDKCDILNKAKELYTTAVKVLKRQLKNPASLQIHNLTFGPPVPPVEEDDWWVGITIEYSAQNGFGGMNRTTFITDLSPAEHGYWRVLQSVDYWKYLKQLDVSSIS